MHRTKRLRIFAGPNGSGKTTLALKLIDNGEFNVSSFVNADEIEREMLLNGHLNCDQFGFQINLSELISFLQNNGMSIDKTQDYSIPFAFSVNSNFLVFGGRLNSYIASDLAAFIRLQLMHFNKSFWFETVFSHESKLRFLERARLEGYRIYFYFISTDDHEINVNRVKIRVEQQGHMVPDDKIISRYYRSLKLLLPAIKLSHRAFLFDNSDKVSRYICEITNGREVKMKTPNVPNWFIKYVYSS